MEREIEELLSSFARVSGLCLSVYDRSLRGVFGTAPTTSPCFCTLLHQSPEALAQCLASDQRAKKRCEDSGMLCTYRCPFGLFEVIVPFYVCGELNGFLMAGKSLPSGEEETVRAAAQPYLRNQEEQREVEEALRSLSCHSETEYEDFCRILRALAQSVAASGGVPNERSDIASEVRRYLRKHYAAPITLAELAMNFHCSTVSLTKWYYRAYEKTIMEELKEIRMERAKELLRSSDNVSVSCIASSCGFTDSGYFSKCFRKYTGMTPAQWRTQRNP